MTCDCGCGTCDTHDRVHLVANFAGVARRETFKGREHIVVPVVMLRQTVVNGAFVPSEELKPQVWNGTPVTVNHPMVGNQKITANDPKTLEQWQIGIIFNAKVKGDRLVAEAWIDTELAEMNTPGLVAKLEGGEPMDVSTGYFPTAQKQSGRYNGKNYDEVHIELKPDHLALLPNDVGACSWADGCGVRANRKGKSMPEEHEERSDRGLVAMFARMLSANRRGDDDDRRQIVADLVSSDDTPFTPDDMYSLLEMSQEALEVVRDTFLPDQPETNADKGADDVAKEQHKAGEGASPATNTGKVSDMSVEDFTALVSNTAKTAANEALEEQLTANNTAKTAANEALEEQLTANKTAELVAKLAVNEDLGLDEDELKAMPLSALEKLAANADKKAKETPAPKANTKANYGGRSARTVADDGGAEPKKYEGMAANVATLDNFADKKKEA